MSISNLSETPISPMNSPHLGQTLFKSPQQFPMPSQTPNASSSPPTPSSTPTKLFSVQANNCSLLGHRFVRNTDRKLASCSPRSNDTNPSPAASNKMGTRRRCTRAELCTVLAAIGLWSQFGEGFKIVIACNSEYIMNRISKWILMWRKNEWWTNTGVAVENLDLWRKLDAKLKNYEMLVQFW